MASGSDLRRLTIVALAMVALATAACSQFELRDKRFYYRAFWNFALREDLAELDSEFNGVDFGHSNLYENLLLTGGKDVAAIEERARKETLAFIATKLVLHWAHGEWASVPEIPTLWSLGVIVAILGTVTVTSLRATREPSASG